MELTPELVEKWQWEISVKSYNLKAAAQKASPDSATMMLKKVDALEGAYSVLGCLLIAMGDKPSPHPFSSQQ